MRKSAFKHNQNEKIPPPEPPCPMVGFISSAPLHQRLI
ncbi:MAG TPA: hypothetical protein DEB17_03940 [Chlorobaculum sp.]|uniref:Uncharacterized protein n=1 Tax=Chlorobaculum tepidum (strain ATCC 49652 / DSM 12025 / NBRC 103806 / TLS) TaxID=194439 RepID=Q8KDZ3_CHLTE|nr:hypothetical protein CT0901 [Chlorobaculum tepidum TLS]HBU23137.1 hypothetical protein [Chlorobaculum sp.]